MTSTFKTRVQNFVAPRQIPDFLVNFSYSFAGDSARSRLQAGAASAITPSGNGTKKSSSSASLALPSTSSTTGASPTNPIARTQSACFAVTKTPSAKGLALIKSEMTEKTPPPTDLSWLEALALLHKLEKQLTYEVQNDIQRLKQRMTASKIELVSRKSIRLHQMRVLLNQTRRLAREEESVMGDFTSVKAVIESGPKAPTGIDEDDFSATRAKLITLGGKLTDIRRRQQRLAGQVEELQGAMKELVNMDQLKEMDGYEFNMESFKRESSALPDMPRLTPTLGTSYGLFNHAPYTPESSRPPSRPSSRMSMESDREFSTIPENATHRTVKLRVQVDSTDDEDLPSDAYLPQQRRKKQLGPNRGRSRSHLTSESSDAESEDCYQVATFNRMTPAEAKQKAEEDRKKALEEEERIRKEVDEQLKKEAEEEERQKEEAAQKKKEEDEKKKAAMEARQKAAAEKAAQLEAKKKAAEEKKKSEADAKRKEEQEKKKAENEAKRKKEEEAKKKQEEAEEKKKAEAEAKKAEVEAKRKAAAEKKKAEEEAERKQKEEEETKKKQAEEEAKRKKEEQWAKKKQNEADAIAQKKEEEAAQQRQQEEERKQIEAEKKAAEDRLRDEAIAAEEAKLKKEAAEARKQAESARAKKEAMEEKKKVEQEIEIENQKKKKELEAKMKAEDNERKHSELAAKLQAEELERKPSTVSRERKISTSASGRASKAEEEEEMLFDEKQQITSKEDLFSAISDTSLKSGKKMRQRRKLKAEEEYEDSEEEVPAKKQSYKSRTTSRDRAPEVQSVREDVEMVSRTSGKSRTTSGERGRLDEPESMDTSTSQIKSRPTSRANAAKSPVLPVEETIEQPKTVKSRTVSRERPKAMEMEIAEDPMDLREAIQKASAPQRKPSGDTAQVKRSAFKSRTSSRETKDTDAYTTTSEEGFPVNNSLSRQASGDTLDRPGQRVSRPPSRFSDMASENIDQLTWEDDDDEESMPSLAPMPGLHGAKSRTSSRDGLHGAKSRTNSRERPASKDSTRPASRSIPDLEPHSSIIDSMPRPGSRTLAQEEEIMRLVGEQEKSRSRASSKSGGSRTSSRERPTTLDIPSAMEQAAGTKRTRTTSRERPKDLFPDFDEENIEAEQQKLSARGAKARTQSRERPPGAGVGRQGSFGEADERTGARGRQRVAPLWPEDSSDSEYNQQNRTRSRTSSADRKRLVGGGRDDLLAEDQGYDALPPGPSPGGYRTYRDEMELDTQQYADQYAAAETALPDDASFHDAADRFDDEEDEPPPTEPIFQRSPAQEQYFQSQEADPISQSLSSASGFSRESISMLDARSRTTSRDKLRQDQASIGSGRSREKLDQQQSSYDYLHPDQEAPAHGARSRTSSRDSRRYGYVPPEEEEMPLRSRTASREGRQTFLSPEESDPIRSRTSSREERYKVGLDDRYTTADDQYGEANVLDYPQYRYDDRQVAPEYEHEDVASKSNKKVSFAEADQKFHLRPEPEVKTIPGTKLFSFSPSATHEQPPKDPLFAPEHLPVNKFETVTTTTEDPTSPQNFLKAMAKGVKGQPKPKDEKSGSIIDSLLRRGKSSSNQGSRNSSRQSSLDRAFSKQGGGSSRSDYSMESGEYEVISK